jgi:predicted Zn-dependent protease
LKDLAKVVDTAVQAFEAEYVEVRVQKLYKTAITVKEAHVEAAKQGIEKGGELRVLVKGAGALLLSGLWMLKLWVMLFQARAGWLRLQAKGAKYQ